MRILPHTIMRILFAFIILFATNLQCKADFFCRITNFSTYNGLSQAHLSNAVTDRMGFIWFATWNGIVRFDGYSFFTFKPIINSDGTIFSNRIYNIKNNSAGNIWCISSDNRLYIFNTATCRFTDMQKHIKEIKLKKVKSVTPKSQDVTWVVFKDGSCLRMEDNDPARRYRFYGKSSKALEGGRAESIKYDSYGNEWILTDKKAINFNSGISINGRYKHIVCQNNNTYLISDKGHIATVRGKSTKVWKLAKGDIRTPYAETVGRNIIAVATDRGITAFDTRKANPSPFNITGTDKAAIKYLYADHRNRLWAFTDTDVMLADLKTKTISLVKTQRSPFAGKIKNPQLIFEDSRHNLFMKPPLGLLSYYDEQTHSLKELKFYESSKQEMPLMKNLKKFFIDKYRNLWLLGEHNISCITIHEKLFIHTKNASGCETRALCNDKDGMIWNGDREGNITLSGPSGERISYLHTDGSIADEPENICGSPVYCIKKDRQERIWIGTKGNGVFIITPCAAPHKRRYKITHLHHDALRPESLCSDSIYDICHDSRGNVWLGSYGQGLIRGRETQKGWRFNKYKGRRSADNIRCIMECRPGILLIGTTAGLVTADIRKPDMPVFYINKYRKDRHGLKGNDIMSLVKAGNRLYACVYGSGISEIAQNNLLSCRIKFNNYIMPTSATADQIKTATANKNIIWIISEKAVSQFDTTSKTFKIYDSSNFTDNINLSEASPIINNGRVIVGTNQGTLSFSSMPPRNMKPNARIVFTGIQYQNDMTIRPLNDIKELTVKPQERSFSLYVSSQNTTRITDTRYRYMLKGYDNSWNYTEEGQHSINYSNLTPGDYELTVQAGTGTWEHDKVSRSIRVTVTPTFTETAWFKLTLIIIMLSVMTAMAYAIVRLNRMRRIIQKKYSLLMAIDNVKIQKHALPEDDKETKDRQFVTSVTEFLTSHMRESRVPVDELAHFLNMSRTSFYNRMKEVTGLSPSDFIKQLRIRQALKIIESEECSITDIAYRTGFSDPKYFAKCFKNEMGMTPTQYIAERKKKK